MKRCVILLSIITFILSSCSRQHSTSKEESIDTKVKDGSAEYRLIFDVPVGVGVELLGYDRFNKKGPAGFFVSDDGTVIIFDNIKGWIKEYKDNNLIKATKVNKVINYPVFGVDDERYYIWLNSLAVNILFIYNREDGSLIGEKYIKHDKFIDFMEYFIFKDGNIYLSTFNHKRYILDNDKLVPIDNNIDITNKDKELLSVKSGDFEWLLNKEGSYQFQGGYSILKADKDNYLYVLKDSTIYKYNTKGEIVGFAKETEPYRRLITDDGDIYIMTCNFVSVKIYEVILGNSD